MSDLTNWGAKLRGAVAQTRDVEAQRTHLFEKRAASLWRDCYERLLTIKDEASAALRSSNLTVRVTRGEAERFSAWVQLEVCGLDAAGAPTDAVKSVRIVTGSDSVAVYEPPSPELPHLDLDDPSMGSLQELVFTFTIAGLRAAIARP